ncbi:hypothetical protein KCTC32516_00331 [Polaribacter huanghezhanensis]|uniref:hypothetical protein n=1 Tax=Polaribacter huanghezhanensis TaxID=1354726 RepID=UPI002647C9AB|nr:hypothetical protein [Polaribacter huanghezhanensis]WKD84994.1 hypothetical protein KCTC32516_00331 [Polaribacter huanghezhanensis]
MNTNSFTDILKNPQKITTKNTEVVKTIVDEYPFFQAARAIYLKGLKNNDSFKYNAELKTTAAYTTDRAVLFDFITSSKFTEAPKLESKEVHQQITEKIVSEKPVIAAKEELSIGKPLTFSKTETHSFNEWMQLASQKKIERNLDQKEPIDKNMIIDNFIKQNPKISKVSKDAEKKEVVLEEKQDSYLMTETLAKVYLEQNKHENAIKAYEILSLKYPEKSGFFADQIKRIRILQKNKS